MNFHSPGVVQQELFKQIPFHHKKTQKLHGPVGAKQVQSRP